MTSPKDGPLRGETVSPAERSRAIVRMQLAERMTLDHDEVAEVLNSHDALKARVQKLEKAAAKRLQTGHDDRCVSNPNDPGVCVCGFMQLKEALRGK